MRHGLLEDVLRIMAAMSKTFNIFQKLCVICFDEMKVRECLEYDPWADEVLGPYKKVQVMMIRGLCSPWKQPVYIQFDQRVTKDLLFQVLTRLEEIGLKVVCCTCDNGAENQSLWKSLNADYRNPIFFHPVTGYPVVCLPDVPHVLKLIRNWLLDHGFVLADGSILDASHLFELHKATRTEISSCYALKEHHFTVKKSERQNVRLAAQLLSNTVGTALLHYDLKRKNAAKRLGEFIILVNNWFDLFNVRTTKMSTPFKSAYGLFLEEQNELLRETADMFSNLRCIGKPTASLQVFQKAVIRTCAGLPILFESVNSYAKLIIL